MCHKLLVVVVIAATGASMVFAGAMLEPKPDHRRSDTRRLIWDLQIALEHYRRENDPPCPPSLDTLVEQHLFTRPPLDGWGQPLLLNCPGVFDRDGSDLVSAGADHRFATGDDIRSWEL